MLEEELGGGGAFSGELGLEVERGAGERRGLGEKLEERLLGGRVGGVLGREGGEDGGVVEERGEVGGCMRGESIG